MNIIQRPWYHDKKTQQTEPYNNKTPANRLIQPQPYSPRRGGGKKIIHIKQGFKKVSVRQRLVYCMTEACVLYCGQGGWLLYNGGSWRPEIPSLFGSISL